jgi:hypothetical protein
MRWFAKPLSIIALAASITSISLAQEKEPPPQVKAKEPTVVTVHGTQSQVDTAIAAQNAEIKERSWIGKFGSAIGKGFKKAYNAAFDWTEDSLGVNDDIDPKQKSKSKQ